MFAVTVASSASVLQLGLSVAVVVAVVGVAHLPTKPRRIVTSAVLAVLVVGVGLAVAVPYHCDPLWKWLGICG